MENDPILVVLAAELGRRGWRIDQSQEARMFWHWQFPHFIHPDTGEKLVGWEKVLVAEAERGKIPTTDDYVAATES